MLGTSMGNFLAVGYYLLFQIGGIFLSFCFFQKQKYSVQILFGSVIGTFMLHWLPTIASCLMKFTLTSHVIALFMFVCIVVIIFIYVARKGNIAGIFSVCPQGTMREPMTVRSFFSKNKILFFLVPTFFYFIAVLLNHTIPFSPEGAIITGQATYGDMNMHLAFITSIKEQQAFPPEYSLLPGTKLSYPFLSDSISSSLYVFGSSLRLAYIMPMLFACLQVFFGFYLVAKDILKSRVKAIVSWILFFYNGGLGFFYFIDRLGADSSNFTRIFTEFYQTPTNYVADGNVRWTNIIVDMLLPQRATLFGWAMLFPILLLLRRAITEGKRTYFVIAGILAGGLPMIHTHSFLSLAMICVVWLTYHLFTISKKNFLEGKASVEKIVLGIGLLLLCFLRYKHLMKEELPENFLMAAGVVCTVAFCGYCLYATISHFRTLESRNVIFYWATFLILVLLLAVPQLFIWTFQQTGGEGFLRGHFNWANEVDLYFWFYLKNMGIMLLFVLAALFSGKKKIFIIAAPAFFIWSVAEFIVFQPNVYDNNKLLLVGFSFLCFVAADYMVDVFRRMGRTPWKYISAAFVLFVCTFSAVLTMGREYVSEYELYSVDQIAVSEYIKDNTDANAVILTNQRHNNAIAALSGRSIVCGTGTFLYFHGLDYTEQELAVRAMYSDPVENKALFSEYDVKYIVIGPEERGEFEGLKEETFASLFECVYTSGDVSLYRVD